MLREDNLALLELKSSSAPSLRCLQQNLELFHRESNQTHSPSLAVLGDAWWASLITFKVIASDS
jgi:hypothetical protein